MGSARHPGDDLCQVHVERQREHQRPAGVMGVSTVRGWKIGTLVGATKNIGTVVSSWRGAAVNRSSGTVLEFVSPLHHVRRSEVFVLNRRCTSAVCECPLRYCGLLRGATLHKLVTSSGSPHECAPRNTSNRFCPVAHDVSGKAVATVATECCTTCRGAGREL